MLMSDGIPEGLAKRLHTGGNRGPEGNISGSERMGLIIQIGRKNNSYPEGTRFARCRTSASGLLLWNSFASHWKGNINRGKRGIAFSR
jgi:hypothetical protein